MCSRRIMSRPPDLWLMLHSLLLLWWCPSNSFILHPECCQSIFEPWCRVPSDHLLPLWSRAIFERAFLRHSIQCSCDEAQNYEAPFSKGEPSAPTVAPCGISLFIKNEPKPRTKLPAEAHSSFVIRNPSEPPPNFRLFPKVPATLYVAMCLATVRFVNNRQWFASRDLPTAVEDSRCWRRL